MLVKYRLNVCSSRLNVCCSRLNLSGSRLNVCWAMDNKNTNKIPSNSVISSVDIYIVTPVTKLELAIKTPVLDLLIKKKLIMKKCLNLLTSRS
jgi:hypothetical protein